jgi:hypothetical protein
MEATCDFERSIPLATRLTTLLQARLDAFATRVDEAEAEDHAARS